MNAKLKITKNRSTQNLHVTVHSVIHNSQNVEKTYASVDEWISKT